MKPLKLFIGSGFGSGYSPVAPGTFGSLLSLVPIYFILRIDSILGIAFFVVICSILTLWVSSVCEEEWGEDPGILVMDEFAGQGLVFLSISLSDNLVSNLIVLSLGFLLFRVFDIWKPLGINRAQKIGKGPGILLDDLIAGLYAFICLKTLIFILCKFFDITF